MSCRKFAEEGDNPVNNPNIYNIVGDNRLSPGLQLLPTKSVFKMRFFFNPIPQLYFLKPEMILLSSAKQNIQVLYILE